MGVVTKRGDDLGVGVILFPSSAEVTTQRTSGVVTWSDMWRIPCL